MNDYPQNPNDLDAFGDALREQFPGLIDIAFEGAVQQTNDETLVQWNDYGFRVHLDNGASFNIILQQVDYAKAECDECGKQFHEDEIEDGMCYFCAEKVANRDDDAGDDYTVASDTGVVIAQVRHIDAGV